MSQNTNSSGSSIGFGGLLTILFIALKLTGVIAWSWWWVLSPILIGLAIYIATFMFIGAITLLIVACSALWGFLFVKAVSDTKTKKK